MSPQLKRFFQKFTPVAFLLVGAILILNLQDDAGIAYDWQWRRLWRYFGHTGASGFIAGPLLKGVWLTIAITCAGLILSMASGLFFAALRLSPWSACSTIARLYVAIWRNTPLLLQLFMAYFLVSPILKLSPFWTAALALGLFEGAYLAEIFRAGILSVHRNQWEAALSLGFGLGSAFFLFILPQALRNVLPALSSQAISLLKDTSLVSAIAVADITLQSQAIVAESFLAFEVWLLAGAIYLALSLFISLPAIWLERHKTPRRNPA